MARAHIHEQLRPVPPVWAPFSPDWRQVVLASRVRLARNLAGRPFVLNLSDSDRKQLAAQLGERLEACAALRGGPRGRLGSLRHDERRLLVERRLLSPDFSACGLGRIFAIAAGHHLVGTANDQDHLRVQAIQPGLALERCWTLARAALAQLGDDDEFAFSPRWGYLTPSPRHLGTGLRAAVMVHLPGLVWTGRIEAVRRGLDALGAGLPAMFRDLGTAGDLFVVTHNASLGLSEEAILSGLDDLVQALVRQEQQARLTLARRERSQLYDHIGRSYGIVRFSRHLAMAEALDGLSALVMGARLGIVPTPGLDDLSRMVLAVQPAHLLLGVAGEGLQVQESTLRADRLRDLLRGSPG